MWLSVVPRPHVCSESTLVRTNRCRAVFAGHTAAVIEVVFENDVLYSASLDKSVRVWMDADGRSVAVPPSAPLTCLIASGRCLMVISIQRDLASFHLAVSSGMVFLYTSNAKSVMVLDESTGRAVHKFDGHEKGLVGPAAAWRIVDVCGVSGVEHVVADGVAYAITASQDASLRKWSLRSGACLAEFTGDTFAVFSAG